VRRGRRARSARRLRACLPRLAASAAAPGGPRVVALGGVQGWRGAWARDVRELVFALDADAAGQQQWRALAR